MKVELEDPVAKTSKRKHKTDVLPEKRKLFAEEISKVANCHNIC